MNYVSETNTSPAPISKKTVLSEKINPAEFNRIWTNFGIDSAYILRRLEDIYKYTEDILDKSKAETKALEPVIKQIKLEINNILSSSRFATGNAAQIIPGNNTRLASSQTIQLGIRSTLDYIANDMVSSIYVIKHPAGASWDTGIKIPVDIVKSYNKTSYWIDTIYTTENVSYTIPDFMNGETLYGPVYDFHITFQENMVVNYFYLTPYGSSPITLSLYGNDNGTWVELFNDTRSDNFETVFDAISTNKFMFRMYQRYCDDGAHEILRVNQLEDILKQMIKSDYPTTDDLKQFTGNDSEIEISKKYAIGFYSVRLGIRSFELQGDASSPVFEHKNIQGTPRLIGNTDGISTEIIGRTAEIENQDMRFPSNTIGYNTDEMYFYPQRIIDGKIYKGKFTDITSFTINENEGTILSSIVDMVSYGSMSQRQICLYDGKLYVNFDPRQENINITVSYEIDSFSIKFNFQGNGYYTPMLETYEAQIQ